MKLKTVLFSAFIILSLIPVLIISALLYQSGYHLSKESYLRNLMESIYVQADYISQTIENDMLSDRRFANKLFPLLDTERSSNEDLRTVLLPEMGSYLEGTEDKISACLFLDSRNTPLYSIGEQSVLDSITPQLASLLEQSTQSIQEFTLSPDVYTLAIHTPVQTSDGRYLGSLISVYNKSYLFKIISSYYEMAESATYICRANGDIISFRGLSDEQRNRTIEQALHTVSFDREGAIEMTLDHLSLSGYYKSLYNSPWYLVGFIDPVQVQTFTNQFIDIYIFMIVGIVLVALLLSYAFSRRLVEPINHLIQVMDGYPESLEDGNLQMDSKKSCVEIRYLQSKFLNLMQTILLVQHNFKGVYRLYQSSTMGDINIDIDVKNQTVHSNKLTFNELMKNLQLPPGACVVERFIGCFCDSDQERLMSMFENMRDKHLAVTQEAEIFTPHLNQKWFHSLVVPMYEDERLARLFIQLRDISSFKQQEHASNEQVKREPLTGLYNRTGFADSVNKLLANSTPNALHGLLFIDMNDFKLVNDNFGHHAGDALLRNIAETLQNSLSPNEIASRFGGDEFSVFCPNTSETALSALREHLAQRLVFPYQTADKSFVVTASIGMALQSTQTSDSLESLLQKADESMYICKRQLKQQAQNT